MLWNDYDSIKAKSAILHLFNSPSTHQEHMVGVCEAWVLGSSARLRHGRETERGWLRTPGPGGGGTAQPNIPIIYLVLIDLGDHMS